MRSRSAQQKGDRFENYLLEVFRREVDVNTHRQVGSGNGLEKNDLRVPTLNLEIEAKNAASFNLGRDWDQTRSQRMPGNTAVLAIRHPKQPEFRETLVVLDLQDFIALLQNQGGTREVSYTADKSMKYDIVRMVEAAKKVVKHFDVSRKNQHMNGTKPKKMRILYMGKEIAEEELADPGATQIEDHFAPVRLTQKAIDTVSKVVPEQHWKPFGLYSWLQGRADMAFNKLPNVEAREIQIGRLIYFFAFEADGPILKDVKLA